MKSSDLGLLILRLSTGAVLASHGLPKLFGGPEREAPKRLVRLLGPNYATGWKASGPEAFGKALDSIGVPMPKQAALASGMAEFGGGMALMLGVGTPVASLVAASNMAVASRKSHWKNGFYGQGGYEFPLLLGAAALAIGFTGPGAISIDRLLK